MKHVKKILIFLLAASSLTASAAVDLVAESVSVNDTTPDPGDFVTVRWTARNKIDKKVGSSQQGVMWSTNSGISRSDTLLAKEFVGPLGGLIYSQTTRESKVVRIPSNAVPGRSYWIGVYADYDRDHSESSESNNDSSGVKITIRGPDLRAYSLKASPSLLSSGSTSITAWPGQTMHLRWTAKNSGNRSTNLIDFSQQGIRWSGSRNSVSSGTILEREGLGILIPGQTSPELHTIKIPSNAAIGETYYLVVEADVDDEFREQDEDNNFSNIISVQIELPVTTSDLQLSDYNYLPGLEWSGESLLELSDKRLQDSKGNGFVDQGATMNPSRCFAPGDRAFLHLDAKYSSDYITLINGSEPTRLKAYYNTSPTESGKQFIATRELNVGSGVYNRLFKLGSSSKRMNVGWTVPGVGEYYVQGVLEVHIEGEWYEFSRTWLGDGSPEPIIVTENRPIVLVHGWSDNDGDTFKNLELLIEIARQRPVRFFQYETDKIANGPRIDESYTELGGGETKSSIAKQLRSFLLDPEGSSDSSTIADCDLIAHSMGGLVARTYCTLGGSGSQRVRRMVTLGTPSYGGLFADLTDILLNNQAKDLEFGNKLAWKLHREWQERRDEMPDLLTIVGTDDGFGLGKYNQSDKVVTCSSASLESLGYPAYYVPMNHSGDVSMISIDDTQHPCWAPIDQFLNNATPTLEGSLPGYDGGADDVGDPGHEDPLRYGAAYILKTNSSENAVSLSSVDFGHNVGSFPFLSTAKISNDGIYSANIVRADASTRGGKFQKTALSSATIGSDSYENLSLTIRAGETVVYVINGDHGLDADGDLLPDAIEDLLIDARSGDSLSSYVNVLPTGDFDGDGIPELLEAALGTNPLVPDFAATTTGVREGYFYLRHDQALTDYGLRIFAQQSATLNSWSEDGVEEVILETHSSSVTKEWRIPVTEAPGFLSLGVGRDN